MRSGTVLLPRLRRRVAALALASGGLAPVLAGAGTGRLDPLGTALGLPAAVFGEMLGAVQLLGGALVLGGVLVLAS